MRRSTPTRTLSHVIRRVGKFTDFCNSIAHEPVAPVTRVTRDMCQLGHAPYAGSLRRMHKSRMTHPLLRLIAKF